LQPVCKPDSVPVLLSAKDDKTGFHHLSGRGITAGILRPTPRRRRAALKPVYMVFQPIRRTAPAVTNKTGELLPHLFTLTPLSEAEGDGYFLLRYYTLTDIFPLGSMVLCVARTFLSALSEPGGRNDGTACCIAKIRQIFLFLPLLAGYRKCNLTILHI
jgi:hypothetical protein